METLEGRIVLTRSFNAALLFQVNMPLQQAELRMAQLQAQVNADDQTMKTDAGSLTFFSESMAAQTTNDKDYARLASDVAQIAALDMQVHVEGSLALQIISQNGAFGRHAPRTNRGVTMQAMQMVLQTQGLADQIKAAVYAGAPVTKSPIAGQPLEPQYPALNTISGFPG